MAYRLSVLRATGLELSSLPSTVLLWPEEALAVPPVAEPPGSVLVHAIDALEEPIEAQGRPAPRDEVVASVWSKYCSIESCDNGRTLDEMLALASVSDCEWVASEKVHGANFCFETDGHDVEYACRSCKLGNGADFYNARSTMPRYHPCVLRAFRLAREQRPALRRLLVYGEYFGGYYPGHPVEPGLKKVQGGVAYSSSHHFYAFDVSPDGEEYVDFDVARALLLAAGFPLVMAPLRRGTLQEVLALDVEALETTIPDQLGHPPLDRFRIAEGVVVRPARELRCGKHRAILKKKARAFWEATNQHTMAQKAGTGPSGGGPPSALEAMTGAARGLVTENRLRAVISKDPQLLDAGQAHRLAGLFTRDVLEELEKQLPEEVEALGKDVARLKKAAQFIARAFVERRIEAIRKDVG